MDDLYIAISGGDLQLYKNASSDSIKLHMMAHLFTILM